MPKGTPPMGTVRGYREGTSLLWVRSRTAERPSPLWVRSGLNKNMLTGSVPSSLSALTKLTTLCVPWPLRHAAFALASEEGRIGRLCAESAACLGASSRGGAAAGLLQYSQRGPLHAM